MNGWGNVFLTVTPDGTALPCHTARMLPGLTFPNVREMSVGEIWYESDGFNRYRGDGWMSDTCKRCPDKERISAVCRCQAFMLAGDAAAPIRCATSRRRIGWCAMRWPAPSCRAKVSSAPLIFRDPKTSRQIAP